MPAKYSVSIAAHSHIIDGDIACQGGWMLTVRETAGQHRHCSIASSAAMLNEIAACHQDQTGDYNGYADQLIAYRRHTVRELEHRADHTGRQDEYPQSLAHHGEHLNDCCHLCLSFHLPSPSRHVH